MARDRTSCIIRASHVDGIRRELEDLREMADRDFGEELRESFREDSRPLPPPDPLRVEALAVLAILGEPDTPPNVRLVKQLLPILRRNLETYRADQRDGFGPDSGELRDGMLVSHDQVRRLLGVLGEPATRLSVGLASSYLNILAGSIADAAMARAIDGAA